MTDIGDLGVELELATDSRGSFNGATATEIKTPAEPHLLYLLKALRDRLDSHAIDAFWCVETKDMICDAMAKETLPHEPLLRLWRTAMIQTVGDTPVSWRAPRQQQQQQQRQ